MDYSYERFSLNHYDLAAFPGPRPGDMAEDAVLTRLDGSEVRLSDLRGDWVVLETGSVTCNMYTRNVDTMAAVRAKHPDVRFVVVYVREAHPGSKLPQHVSLDAKAKAAERLREEVGEDREILLDDMQGSMHRAYGAMPNMVYVINPEGRVVYRHDWTVPEELERVLAERERIHAGEHAYTGELKAFGPRTNWHLFKTVGRGGWDAIWDLVKVLPLFLVEHLKVDRLYRTRERGQAE